MYIVRWGTVSIALASCPRRVFKLEKTECCHWSYLQDLVQHPFVKVEVDCIYGKVNSPIPQRLLAKKKHHNMH